MSNQPTLMAILAHPDDETLCGGTMIQAVERGWRVVLVCATGGEAGEISDPALATPETLGEVRAHELQCACDVLGVTDLVLLGYCDSGMAGSTENDRVTSFIRAEAQHIIARLFTLMEDIRPTITITFEPFGIYGHPDHIAISRFATQAFDQYAAGVEDAVRLFYSGLPHSYFRQFQELATGHGIEIDDMQEILNGSEDIGPRVTHRVDVSAQWQPMLAALKCHRTQLGNGSMFDLVFLPEFRDVQSSEYYIQVRPPLNTSVEVEASLLD